MGESRPSEEAIALFTNVFGYAPDPEALHAGECWQAERIDAALRRAKAEGLREVKYEALGSRIKCFKSDTLYAEGNDDALNALVKWIDARAAQIEEGA